MQQRTIRFRVIRTQDVQRPGRVHRAIIAEHDYTITRPRAKHRRRSPRHNRVRRRLIRLGDPPLLPAAAPVTAVAERNRCRFISFFKCVAIETRVFSRTPREPPIARSAAVLCTCYCVRCQWHSSAAARLQINICRLKRAKTFGHLPHPARQKK